MIDFQMCTARIGLITIRMAAIAMIGLTAPHLGAQDSDQKMDVGQTATLTIEQLIDRLGDDRFAVRQQASLRLQEIGEASIPALETATRGDDAEIRARAERILAILSSQQSIQCKYNETHLNFRTPTDNPNRHTLVKDLFIHERQRIRWKVTRTDKGHLIQVANGPRRGWYFEFDNESKPFLDGGLEVARCLQLNKERTERALWKLTKQEEQNTFFIQPSAGKFKNWYLDIDEPQSKLFLAKRVVPGAYWRIGRIDTESNKSTD